MDDGRTGPRMKPRLRQSKHAAYARIARARRRVRGRARSRYDALVHRLLALPHMLADLAAYLRNAPPRAPVDEPAFWSLYASASEPLTAAPAALRRRDDDALLVVITTYQRPDACAALLDKLHGALQGQSLRTVRVLVLNDRGARDYEAVREVGRRLFGDALVWLDARERLGKPGFWRAYQVAFLAARALDPALVVFLQDDVDFQPALLEEVSRALAGFDRPDNPAVLYLFSEPSDERWGRWTFHRRRVVAPGWRRTQWFDLQAFAVGRAFFTLLHHRVLPVHPARWQVGPTLSSGVGQQLTLRLQGRASVYQAAPPLVGHGSSPSEMNPEARARRPLSARAVRPGAARRRE